MFTVAPPLNASVPLCVVVPVLEASVPETIRGSAPMFCPARLRVAPALTVVPVPVAPSAEPLPSTRVPADTVVAPV